jgi:putative ABC transport system permease protein
MLKNYLLVAFRTLKRRKGYAAINVTGLAVGLACAFLITLYLQHELAYDRHHPDVDRLYRVTTQIGMPDEEAHYARAAALVPEVLRETDPDVEAAARLVNADPVVHVGTEVFIGERFFYTDEHYFDVFGVEPMAGSVLTAPGQVVVTERAARRFFGDAAAVGKTVRLGEREADLEVVGVVPDVPEASHLRYDVLAQRAPTEREQLRSAMAWVSNINYLTYVRLREGARPEAVEARLAARADAEAGALLQQFGASMAPHLQPVTDIHLHSRLTAEAGPGGDVLYVTVFGVVAAVVLLIACINFVNLATARALDRAREVGVRKALGAERGQLARQFLAETALLTGFALLLAIGLAWGLLPVFNALTGREVGVAGTLGALGVLAAVAPVVALLAGAYPAYVLSGYEPSRVLRGRFSRSASGLALRRGLVVTQFALSVVLVTGAFVVQEQLAFTRHQQLGFDREHVVVLPLRPDAGIRAQERPFKATVLESAHIAHAALTDQYPAGSSSSDNVFIPAGRSDDEGVHANVYTADFDLVPTLGMTLAAGRGFDPALPTDSAAYLVNETAARMAGFTSPEDAALDDFGATPDAPRERHDVIGFVEDFHFQSFRNPILPLVIRMPEDPDFPYDYLLARVHPGSLEPALADLERAWGQFSSGTPFSPSFLDAEFDALYRQEARLAEAFGYFTGLAVLIACLGLFGLATYTAEQRTKEIGVRKVLGATAPQIVRLLAWDFARPVLLAVVLAAPVAYLAAERWLSAFAYRIDLGPVPFVVAGVVALAVALLSVGVQTLRTATADPVKSLRYE